MKIQRLSSADQQALLITWTRGAKKVAVVGWSLVWRMAVTMLVYRVVYWFVHKTF